MTTIAGCRRVVCWGYPPSDKHSHRHIWNSFARAARKMGIEGVCVEGTDDDRLALRAGDMVFAIDIWSERLAPAIRGIKYVLHNFPGDHEIFDSPMRDEDFVRLQVYTSTAAGERLGTCRYWLAENRTLTQPWGTDLFSEEFYEPVFNAASREAVFVGAVWDTAGQGNAAEITELREVLAANGLRFVHRTQITEEEMITLVRGARLAPAIAGSWQAENNYLPCRVFKNVSYGQLAITNVPRFFDLFSECSLNAVTMPELIGEALTLKRDQWVSLVLDQQRVAAKFTYRESLCAIEEAFSR
jgi:hypothetical protein